MELWLANSDCVSAVAELDNSCYKKNALTLEQWQRILKKQNIMTLLVGKPQSPIAFLTMKTDGTNNFVLRLAVAEEERHKGIGTELIDFVGSDRNLMIRLRESNECGIAFLKKNKFKAVEVLKKVFGEEDGILFLRQPLED